MDGLKEASENWKGKQSGWARLQGMVLPAEPAAPAKEPCSGLVVHCTQIFAQEDLWSQLAKEGRSLGCLCVSGHFPGSPCLSDMLLGRAVHCLGALQASLSSCQDTQ